MKKLLASALTFISATAATAGSITYTPPIADVLQEPGRMGGSGAWLVPLIIAAVILLAVTQKDNTPVVTTNGQN